MTAPTPAVVSEHEVSSVTAAVEIAKSRSAAGAFSFLRPKRTSPRPKPLRLLSRRAGSGLGVAGTDLALRAVAGPDLCLQLRELAVHLRRRGDLRQLAVELSLVACRHVLERAAPRLQLLLGADELLLLVGEPLHLPVHALQLLLGDRLALERLPREVLAVRSDRLARLRLELDDVLLELLLLQLEALLRGDDVGD